MEDHSRYKGPFSLNLLVREQKHKQQKNLPILLLRQSRKPDDAWKGVMRISEISDKKAALPPPLDKLGDRAGGKQSAGVAQSAPAAFKTAESWTSAFTSFIHAPDAMMGYIYQAPLTVSSGLGLSIHLLLPDPCHLHFLRSVCQRSVFLQKFVTSSHLHTPSEGGCKAWLCSVAKSLIYMRLLGTKQPPGG